ncbi:MAG: 2-oxoacid:acceptor oxidoreductase subunit alpha [Deltaproteobacteria bacterium]|nr:2-oxoacid:acceptor oxidoreductase subunit alpha [Deltaproteobacteria bacterium]
MTESVQINGSSHSEKSVNKDTHRVVIRFAGDSGDGMQLTGTEFTRAAAFAGNDISTFPDFPAEIRAPAGTVGGVSGFQLHFADEAIYTPGDTPDVLVAMNPAALKKNLEDLKKGGVLIANSSAFTKNNLRKVGYEESPLDDDSLDEFRLVPIDMTGQVERALNESGLSTKEMGRCKNFYALGLMYWMYNRDKERQEGWIRDKFKKIPHIADANIKAFNAGYNFGITTELIGETYEVAPVKMEPGRYRNIMGNQATVLGLVAAAQKSGLPLFYGSYPITPASDVLHGLARHKDFSVTTFQAEDEIAAMGATIGAAFGGSLAITGTSGPGLALKGEALGLGGIMELPMVVVNVQRGGPSTGLPTKTEQSDLLQALYGRNGDSSLPVIAAQSPGDCFYAAFEACSVAVKYMTPVILLTDGYLANGAEPWKIPDAEKLASIDVKFGANPERYEPYARDEKTLARQWVVPGTLGMQHRIGGLEKDARSGGVSYDANNHQEMTDLRREKTERITQEMPALAVEGDADADLLLISWGGTYGTMKVGVMRAREQGLKVAHLHLRWMNPLASDVTELLKRYKTHVCCELNNGQLQQVLRAKTLVDIQSFTKVQGKPFMVSEIIDLIKKHVA